ncbi:MAG TPA: ROK family protein [Candidatus Saccharibacteria bacterium]|jgi:predicted NBD/HSP70 family sugar kinase|nr:ROK family protein [Candidatus Saccharibacteria bacterium]
MIIGVDIGGTKTLISVFTESGKLLNEVRLATNHNYDKFLQELAAQARQLETSKAKIACVAVPGRIDRKTGVVKRLGNLPWRDKPIRDDVAKALNISSVYIENDSKLAGLGETRALQHKYERVYYITLSTGIGGTLIVNRNIAQEVIDGEVGMVPFMHEGKMTKWEDFSSGRAFFEKYGQKAVDVDDPLIWEEFAQNIGPGIAMICCIYQVEAIIFGGGLGQHLEKFAQFLTPFINNLPDTITKPQDLVKAHYADESVIYGCYSYAKDKLA